MNMNSKLNATIGVFWINTICTLKCKRCITLTPYHKNPRNFSLKNISEDIDRFFEIYEWIDHFDIEGGESFLHPELHLIVNKAFQYKEHFKRLHILTNATVLPNQLTLESLRNKDVFIIIDDYGNLSDKKKELVEILISNNIEYRIDKYYGSNQYYDGWIDFGDMQDRKYSKEALLNVFKSCRQAQIKAPYIKDGKIFTCSIQAAGIQHIPLLRGEYINLRDSTVSVEERIKIATNFNKSPLKSCEYCNGFDAEKGERYPAAEQLPKNYNEELKICL